jgi:tetratricopeptide (TPR) repeat protein
MKAERIRQEALGGSLVRYTRMAELYQQAVDLDPDFALAWAGLALAQSKMYRLFEGTPTQAETAETSANQALALDPESPTVQLAVARFYQDVRQDRIAAAKQIDIGLATSPNHAGLIRERARVLRLDPERWDEALAVLRRSAALNPRSSRAASDLGWHLMYMRRHDEAIGEINRALSITPGSFRAIRYRAMLMLVEGDLGGAREFLRRAAESLDRDEFIAQLAVFDDLFWVLDDDWQDRLLELDLEPFGNYETDRSIAFAHTYHLRGDREKTVQFAERARSELARQLERSPDNPDANPLIGVMYAYLDQDEEALKFGQKAIEIWERQPNVPYPYSHLQMVRILSVLGETEAALDYLEPLLEAPLYLTPGWLSIDPMFDPLRGHPRFEALLQ